MSVMHNIQLALPNIRGFDRSPAIYLLRHVPSKRVYVSYTQNLRVRLHWWLNRLSSSSNTGAVPIAMRQLLDQVGYDPSHWTFAVLDQGPFTRRDTSEERFGHYLSRLRASYPALMLNSLPAAHTKPVTTYNPGTRARGTSPRSWLKGRLGLGDPMPSTMPAHGWDIDPYILTPTGHFNVPFALYLYRSMRGTNVPHRRSGVYNPSVEAIRGLFDVWRKENAHDPAVLAASPPLSIEDACDLPTPAPPVEKAARVEGQPVSRAISSINGGAVEHVPNTTFVPAPLSDEDSLILDRFGL